MSSVSRDEIIWRHIRNRPFYRAIVRSAEDHLYQGINLPEPSLDLGCGDGHFAAAAFDHLLTFGLDRQIRVLTDAPAGQPYRFRIAADSARLPFPDQAFGSVISNSTLEHVADLDGTLREIARVTRPGGMLAFTVPNQRFEERLLGAQLLRRLGRAGLAQGYARLFNRVSRHVHLDPGERWVDRVRNTGFRVERCEAYFSERALHWMEAGHLGIGFTAICKLLTGRWVWGESRWARQIPFWLVARLNEPVTTSAGVCTFISARRTGEPEFTWGKP